MHINPGHSDFGFDPLRSPLLQYVLRAYGRFSSLRDDEITQENLLGFMTYRTRDGRKFTLSTKINNLGYIITQLLNGKMESPLQEMVVRARPDFQRQNAPPELRARIKQAILRSIADVTDGVTMGYEQARQVLFIRIPLESERVQVVESMDDEGLVEAVLRGEKEYIDTLDISHLPITLPRLNIREHMDNKSDKPLTIALGSTKLFVFQQQVA